MSEQLLDTEAVSATATQAPPAAMFQGYDTFMSAGRSQTAVKGDTIQNGADVEVNYAVCYDYSQLQQALNISASIAASFGFGSVSDKTTFSQSLNVTNTSVTVVVYARNALKMTGTNVALTAAQPTNLNDFFQSYGDSFVNYIVAGGEYIAAYVFYAQTTEEQESISTEFQAQGISSSGTVDASVQANFETALKNINTKKTLKQYLSGYSGMPLPSGDPIDGIFQFATNLSSMVPNAPVILSYSTTGYEQAGIPQATFTPIITTRSLFNGIGSQPGLADAYATLMAILNKAQAIENVYSTYGYTGDADLPNRIQQIQADIKTLDLLFNQMDQDPTKTYSAPSLPSLLFGTPTLNCELNTTSWGGTWGTPFTQITLADVSASTKLVTLIARGGAILDFLSMTYMSDQGAVMYNVGGSGGDSNSMLQLQPGEWITGVSGWWGDNGTIHQITFTTSKNQSFTCPATLWQGTNQFDWTAGQNELVIGFVGQADAYVQKIGVITGTFMPATWVPYRNPTIG